MMLTPIYDEVRELALGEGFDPEAPVQLPVVPWAAIPKRERSKLVKRTDRIWRGVDPDAATGEIPVVEK